MDWLRWHLGPHKAVIVTVALVGVAFVLWWSVAPPSAALLSANNGFGPDWDCTAEPKGGPTCIKKVMP